MKDEKIEAVVVEKKTIVPPKESNQTAKIGVFLSIFALLISFAALGFSYLQLAKHNNTLQQQVVSLEQQRKEDVEHLQTLTQDVQQLQQLQQANLRDSQDITALYMQLNTLNDQIDQLPLPPTPLQPTQETMPTSAVNEANMSWWQKGWNKTLEALRQIVIVRYNENKISPVILPEEKHFLYLNLHAEVQNAMWAVLHRNYTVYQTSLGRVTNWVQQYFVQDSPATIAVLQSLAALRSVSIQPQDQSQAQSQAGA